MIRQQTNNFTPSEHKNMSILQMPFFLSLIRLGQFERQATSNFAACVREVRVLQQNSAPSSLFAQIDKSPKTCATIITFILIIVRRAMQTAFESPTLESFINNISEPKGFTLTWFAISMAWFCILHRIKSNSVKFSSVTDKLFGFTSSVAISPFAPVFVCICDFG